MQREDCTVADRSTARWAARTAVSRSLRASAAWASAVWLKASLQAWRCVRAVTIECRANRVELHRAAQITECLRVLTRKVGIVDKPCPFRFRASINVLEGVFGLDHRMCGLLDFAKRGVGTSLQR